jgi:DNA-binding CsgD family transcriptional regulator
VIVHSAVVLPFRPPERRFAGAELIRDLERRLRLAKDPQERAGLADQLIPEYVTRGDIEGAARTLAWVGELPEGLLRPKLLALTAVVKAMCGDSPYADAAAAMALLPDVPETVAAAVRARLGTAMFFARDALKAEEHSLHALWLAEKHGLRRMAGRAATALYAIAYHLNGDLQAAAYYAEVVTIQAVAAGDSALRGAYLAAQYDLAAVFADWDKATTLRALVRRDSGPDVASRATATAIADALLHGSRSDFSAMRGRLDALTFPQASVIDSSFALALRALASAGLGQDAEARGEARRAFGLCNAERMKGELAYHTIRRRIGGVVAAYTSILIGDSYHGSRALRVRANAPGAIGTLAEMLARDARGLPVDTSDPNVGQVRGYLAVALLAHEARSKREAATPEAIRRLTVTELTVLRSVALGKSNAEIARERRVSRNAVERRLMSAYEKLGVRTRGEAIARIAKVL